MASATTPTHRIKSGVVEVAIWANEAKKSGTFYSVTASRSYKTGEKWNYTSSFGFDDLPVLEKLLGAAWTWIHQAREAARDSNHAANVSAPEEAPDSE